MQGLLMSSQSLQHQLLPQVTFLAAFLIRQPQLSSLSA